MGDVEVQKHSVHTLVFRSLKRTHDMFLSEQPNLPPVDDNSEKIKMACKTKDEYGFVQHLAREHENKQRGNRHVNDPYPGQQHGWTESTPKPIETAPKPLAITSGPATEQLSLPSTQGAETPGQLQPSIQARFEANRTATASDMPQNMGNPERSQPSSKALTVSVGNQQMIVPRKAPTMPKPQWHPPWKLYRVISGHTGWVRSIAVEPGNQWFATGSADRIIKIWDLASGTLKLSLTGHISTVRGLIVSPRQPYLFSCGEDKLVKCWDLEYNKTMRHYHGHLSAVYGIDMHPTIDVLVTCSRDSTVRVWDMRTKACIHTLTGHTNTVSQVRCQAAEPQIVSGSHDCTIRLWDLAAGRSKVTLTNHKKSVRSIALHPTQYTMASASPDNIKQWKFPDGNFIQNLSGHNAIVNTLACNQDNVLVSGGDNGTMYFWDWKSGYNFQRIQTTVQPGSIDSEAGIFASTFDKSGSRLFTCEADKTIKIYKEDDLATEETHPINWKPEILRKRKY